MFRRRPTLADIYLKELATRLDGALVPVFPPDTPIRPGTVGRFEEGRFLAKSELAVDADLLPKDSAVADWSFSSDGSITLGPTVELSTVLGSKLASAELKVSKKRSVVASFIGMTERRLTSPSVDQWLKRKYASGALDPRDVFVWSSRTATSGTVLIERKGNLTMNVNADPTLVAGLISVANLGVGVTFGGGNQASFQYSGKQLSAFVQVKSLRRTADGAEIQGFEPNVSTLPPDLLVANLDVGSLLSNVDFSAPEF